MEDEIKRVRKEIRRSYWVSALAISTVLASVGAGVCSFIDHFDWVATIDGGLFGVNVWIIQTNFQTRKSFYKLLKLYERRQIIHELISNITIKIGDSEDTEGVVKIPSKITPFKYH